jgi:hypothetical protein
MGVGIFGIVLALVVIAYWLVDGAVPFGKSVLFAAYT